MNLFNPSLPIIGSIRGVFVLTLGRLKKSKQIRSSAYSLLMIPIIVLIIVNLNGEMVEETAGKIKDISKIMIEQHIDFTINTLLSFRLLKIVALIGVFISIWNGYMHCDNRFTRWSGKAFLK